jgi:glycosyltransferase involved in cell wall biosynthesis
VKIGINLLWLLPGVVGGTETHVRGLIGALAESDRVNTYVLFTNRENHGLFETCGANFVRELCDFSAASRSRRILAEQVALPIRAARARLDVLHSPGYTIALAARCRKVVTIHDCNAWAIPASVTGARRTALKILVRASSRVADAIVTVSEFSAGEIIKYLRVDRSKVFVVPNAPAPRAAAGDHGWTELAHRLGIAKSYIFAFSSVFPHKNIEGLIRAFACLPERASHQLVLAGHAPHNAPALETLACRLGIGASVVLTGYLPDRQLQMALEHATALAFPSIYEGFGIPVLEAMAAGVPVACSARAALPEIAGNAALFFDPHSPAGIADVLHRMLVDDNLRQALIAAGYANVKRFSWQRAACETLRVYDRVTDVHLSRRSNRYTSLVELHKRSDH